MGQCPLTLVGFCLGEVAAAPPQLSLSLCNCHGLGSLQGSFEGSWTSPSFYPALPVHRSLCQLFLLEEENTKRQRNACRKAALWLIGNTAQHVSSHPFIWQCWNDSGNRGSSCSQVIAGMRWRVRKAQFTVEPHFTHRSSHVHKTWSRWALQVWTTGWSPSVRFLRSHCREWCFCGRRQTRYSR